MQALSELLTPAELAAADTEWRRRFLDTTPIAYDEARYRPMVDAFYAGLGRPAPAQIRYFSSPIAACLALEIEQGRLQARYTEAAADAGVNPGTSEWATLEQAIDDTERDGCRHLPASDEVVPLVQAWVTTPHPRYAQVVSFLHDLVFTNADAAFGAYFDALDAKGLSAEVPAQAQQMRALAREIGYLYLYDHLCLIIDRPSVIQMNDQGRFHSHDGPALAFRDGWTRGCSNGMAIPRELVTPGVRETWLTAERVRDERNSEVRRVMMEILTPARFIADLGISPVDASDYGTLYKVELPDEDEAEGEDKVLAMLRVINATEEYEAYETVDRAHWSDANGDRQDALPAWIDPTGAPEGWRYVPTQQRGIGPPFQKEYWLRVPPTMERARQAVAWTFNLPEDEYAPVQES